MFICEKPQEECGIFAVIGHDDASELTFKGLCALQHRGQAAAGICSSDGENFYIHKQSGLVKDVFKNIKLKDKLPGSIAIGHTRFSTSGMLDSANIQPIIGKANDNSEFAIAHNGQININSYQNSKYSDSFHLARNLERLDGYFCTSFNSIMRNCDGAFALAAIHKNTLFIARDDIGIRPLILGKLDDAYIICSETCALDAVGACFMREIKNGTIGYFQLENDKISWHQMSVASQKARNCIFEFIYFAHPSSYIDGINVFEARKNMGRKLAEEAADHSLYYESVVLPVPNSGLAAALGFAEQAGLELNQKILNCETRIRSFIASDKQKRKETIYKKHIIDAEKLQNTNVIIIDDSIVSGLTIKYLTKKIRESGAARIDVKIASPIIRYPDYYGLGIKEADLLSKTYPTIEQMAKHLAVDSLQFLSIDGLYQAICQENRNNKEPQFSDHPFIADFSH